MPLLAKFKNLTTGTPKRTLISSILITLLIPLTIFANTKRWELRREAAEEPPITPEESGILSQWVPVPVEDYKKNLDSVVDFAKSEKLDLEPMFKTSS